MWSVISLISFKAKSHFNFVKNELPFFSLSCFPPVSFLVLFYLEARICLHIFSHDYSHLFPSLCFTTPFFFPISGFILLSFFSFTTAAFSHLINFLTIRNIFKSITIFYE